MSNTHKVPRSSLGEVTHSFGSSIFFRWNYLAGLTSEITLQSTLVFPGLSCKCINAFFECVRWLRIRLVGLLIDIRVASPVISLAACDREVHCAGVLPESGS